MLYIMLFLLVCFIFHYKNSNKKDRFPDNEFLVTNEQNINLPGQPESKRD